MWAANQRPRLGDVVYDGSNYYSNVAGYNDVLTNTNVWFQISSTGGGATPIPAITLTAANISGSDPFWIADLSAQSTIPALPRTFDVWVDQGGTGDFQKLEPVSYDASTKILSNMPSKTDFSSLVIKIFVS